MRDLFVVSRRMSKTKWDRWRTDIREPVNVGKLLFRIWMKGVACFGFDTRIYISNVLARLSPFLRFDSRLRGISNVTHSRVSLGEIEIEIEIEGTARITYDLSLLPPSIEMELLWKKGKKKKKERIRYWNIRNRNVTVNDNCTVRTSMDEEHEVDFKVSLSKCFWHFS